MNDCVSMNDYAFDEFFDKIEKAADKFGIVLSINYSTDFGWSIDVYQKVENNKKILFNIQDLNRDYTFKKAYEDLQCWYNSLCSISTKSFYCPKCATSLGKVLRSVSCPNCGIKLVDLE